MNGPHCPPLRRHLSQQPRSLSLNLSVRCGTPYLHFDSDPNPSARPRYAVETELRFPLLLTSTSPPRQLSSLFYGPSLSLAARYLLLAAAPSPRSSPTRLPRHSMSNTKKSDGLHFNKRKREDSAGGSVGTATTARAPASVQQTPWQGVLATLGTGVYPSLPPTVLAHFHAKGLSDYKAAQLGLARAVATQSNFGLRSSNDAVASVVSNSLKVPSFQALKGAESVPEDASCVEVKDKLEKEIALVQRTATTYLTTLYDAQVALFKAKLDITAGSDALAASLSEYAQQLLTNADDPDPTVWQPCVTLIKAAYLAETRNLKLEYTAILVKEHDDLRAKADAIAVAEQDAVMTDSTAPVVDTVVSSLKLLLPAALAELKKKDDAAAAQKAKPSNEASSSKPHPKGPKASSSSSTKAPPTKTQRKDHHGRNDSRAGSRNSQNSASTSNSNARQSTSKDRSNGKKGGSGRDVERTEKAKSAGKKKQKSKRSESPDSGSD
ncbi:hypothetical protein DFH09DRAFT_1334503 [Mycena vulgaris]|nr:hypothetical protein DFH09DRAFT_1334503 [Mycena vulgaris]